jgi:acetolactate synthase I/II/III large subunit
VMVHVSVGTANAACAVINAARENVPMIVTAGRTPILEDGALGARDTFIQWSQEMYDQAGLVREVVKWDYELRDSRQLADVVSRAFSMATSDPKGPVYLSLPREVLAASVDADTATSGGAGPPAGPRPDPRAIEALADRIAAATMPVIVTTASGADHQAVSLLADVCNQYAIGLTESAPRYLNASADHPFHLGRPEQVYKDADVVLFIESDVPWIPTAGSPRADAFVAQAAIDPLFGGIPMRSHRSDLTIAATPASLLEALFDALKIRAGQIDPERAGRLAARASAVQQRRAAVAERERAADGVITRNFIALALADGLDERAVVFNEYPLPHNLLGRRDPGTYFSLPSSGGLGWALPAALGAKLAAPDRVVVAAVGDGAYLFANPAACHHAARKHDLPVLTVVVNNERWAAVDWSTKSVYPQGMAAETGESRLSDLSPLPAFEEYVHASGGHGERVTKRHELAPALGRALHAVQVEGRQALLNIECP